LAWLWLGLALAWLGHGLAWLCRGLAWLGLAWLGLAWLGFAWLGLALLGLAWLGLALLGLAWLCHGLASLVCPPLRSLLRCCALPLRHGRCYHEHLWWPRARQFNSRSQNDYFRRRPWPAVDSWLCNRPWAAPEVIILGAGVKLPRPQVSADSILDALVLSAAGRGVVQVAQRMNVASWYSAPSTNTCASRI
jgi:hypothetical protein